MAILDALRTPSLDMLARINRATTFWPPVAYFMAQPLYILLGVSTDVTALTTTLWFALAILFTYFLGRRLYNWRTGLFAAVLFSFYPAVYLQSRTYYVDIALTAMVLITLYCLLRTDSFRSRRASLAFGIALGLAALTKNAFIIMTIGPIMGVVVVALWSGGRTAWQQFFAWRPRQRLDSLAAGLVQRIVNIVLAGMIAMLLAAPWYISHAFILASNALQVTSDVHLAAKPAYWYAAKFDEGVLIWPYFLLIVGLVFGFLRFRRHWFTVVWLISSVVILTMITRQNVRYLLPVLPAVALLSVDWIVLLPNRLARTVLLGVTAVVQVFMFFVMSWGAPGGWNLALNVPIQDAHNPFNDNTTDRPQAIDPLAFLYYQYPPKAHRWPVESILDRVIADVELNGQADQVNRFVSLSKVLDFEYSTFAYETELARTQDRPGAQTLLVADVQQRTDYLIDFLDFDYVLYKSNDKSNMERRQNHIATRQLWASGDEMLRQRFNSLATWKLNDGSYAELLKREGPPLALLEPDELRPILKRILELTPFSQQAQQMLAQIGFEEAPKPEPISLAQLWQAAAHRDPDPAIAPREPLTTTVIPDFLLTLPEPTPLPQVPDQVRDVGALLDSLAVAAPDDPLTQVRLGAFALQEGALPEVAGEHFQRAIDLDPETWLAYGLWADGLSNTGQITQAVQLVEQGLVVMPDSPPLTAQQARLLAGAVPAIDEALAATLERGRAALQDRNWADAIAAGQNAVATAPGRYETHLLLGDAYRGAGELAQAVPVYQRAVEMAPQLSFLHARVGETQARLGRPVDALSSSLTALAVDQSRWENWYALGRSYAAQATLSTPVTDLASAQLAESALQRAVELAPAENQAPQRALEDLRAALVAKPADGASDSPEISSTARRAEAQGLLQSGNPEQALTIYRSLVESNSTDRESRMGVAAALAALERREESLAEYQQISADWPDFASARIRQGEILEQQGDIAAAIAIYEGAVAALPDSADAHFALGFAYRRSGQLEQAIASFEAGLALDPNRQAAQEALDALRNGS